MLSKELLKNSVNKNQFAKLCAVHRSTVTKAVQDGRIISDASGLIDLKERENLYFIKDQLSRQATNFPFNSEEHKKLCGDCRLIDSVLCGDEISETPVPDETEDLKAWNPDDIEKDVSYHLYVKDDTLGFQKVMEFIWDGSGCSVYTDNNIFSKKIEFIFRQHTPLIAFIFNDSETEKVEADLFFKIGG